MSLHLLKFSLLKGSENEFRVITVIILFALIFILKYSELGSRGWRYN